MLSDIWSETGYGMADASRKRVLLEDRELLDLVESADSPVLLGSGDGGTIAVNRRMADLLGYDIPDLLETGMMNLFAPSERGRIYDRTRRYLAGEVMFPSFTTRLLRADGTEVPAEVIGLPIRYRGKPAYLNFVRDLSLERHLERELQSAQKLQSLGTLAGGIAHDFNNLLMVIEGTVSMMLMDMDADHPWHDDLKSIEERVRSGARLTRQLLGYARQGKFEARPLDFAELIQETTATFGRARKDITVSHEFDDESFWVFADKGDIENVLLNLLVNASDAMPDGGRVTLRLKRAQGRDIPVSVNDPIFGEFVRLVVTDTGEGMDEQTLERVFDPFFTTKEVGKGTGLGLSSVYGIVKRHGGYISVTSTPGLGTSFDVFLPSSVEEKDAESPAVAEAPPSQGAARILIVDDEAAILKLAERLLDRMGYKVYSAQSGQEAVAVYNKLHDDIDLVILDMVMPGMSGEETRRALKAINPAVDILISTGYSIETASDHGIDRDIAGFIQKPYSVADLSSKLNEVLGKDQQDT